jgi:ribonucleotide reductase alpha subunit
MFNWFNEDSERALKAKYFLPGEGVVEASWRLANRAAELYPQIPNFAERVFNLLEKGWIAPASPVWANFGTKRGQAISCFSSYVPDNLEGILDSVKEVGMLTRHGGGTAGYFGDLRPKNAKIGSGGVTNGPISFMQMFDTTMRVVSQSNVRRGSFAAYLPVEHPDILDFLMIKDKGNSIQDLSFAVTVTDNWLQEMVDGDKDKQAVWTKVLQSRKEKGQPYIGFIDTVNRHAPDVYKDKGLRIDQSNLCVTGDTLITTPEGDIRIDSVVEQVKTIWNGFEWSDVLVTKTSDSSEIVQVTTNKGKSLRCTPYHKFYDRDGVEIRAIDLKTGTDLMVGFNPSGRGLMVDSIESVSALPDNEPTYCFTEPKRNLAVFNGILTGNCNEIWLHTNQEKTFVCCLTAMNLLKYDEWKDTDAVEVCTYFLDAVMEDFIQRTAGISGLERARKFAIEERALGLGATGWHSLLKSKGIPFDSLQARYLTVGVFGALQNRSLNASKLLAHWFGEPELLKGYGRRNSTLMAVAPNTSSAEIIGVSQGIEPDRSNYFVKELAWGIIPGKRDIHLERLLESKGKNLEEVWQSILGNNGSVMHLPFLSDEEKAVFKTFWEIDQYELLRQAGIRQQYIDQGQSLNIFVPPKTPLKELNKLHLHAWKCGVKGLYYQRSEHASVWKDTGNVCSACSG